MEASKPKLHPVMMIAAVAVILFSLVGIAAMTGLLPGSQSKTAQPEQTPTATTEEAKPATQAALEPAKAATKPATKAATKPAPIHQATASRRPQTARSESTATVPSPAQPAAICSNCGVVDSVRAVEREGEGSGLGVIAGGVTGAIVGNQIGKGTGRDLATIAGAVGGGFLGNKIEKNVKKTTVYEVTVRMENGSYQTVGMAQSTFRAGDRVKVVDGTLVAR